MLQLAYATLELAKLLHVFLSIINQLIQTVFEQEAEAEKKTAAIHLIQMLNEVERLRERGLADATRGGDRVERRYVRAHAVRVVATCAGALQVRANVRRQFNVVVQYKAAHITLIICNKKI